MKYIPKDAVLAEIDRIENGLMDAQGNFEYPEHEGAYHILCNLDSYIDSMQEEPDLNWKDMSLQEKKDLVAKLSEDIRKEEPTTSVWHYASEIPKFRKEFLAIVYTPTDVLKYVKTIYSEDEYCLIENDKWAYIDDILKL